MDGAATGWAELSIGQPIVDGWTMRGVLGQGAMSIVLEISKGPLAPRAMKVLRRIKSEEDGERCLRECAVTAMLEHPNIVHVENLGVLADGSPYLVMERLYGCTLREVVRAAREAPPRSVSLEASRSGGAAHPLLRGEVLVEIVGQIGAALAYAHSASPPVVHRDIKPDNIFLHQPRHTPGIEVKLLDFGVAALLVDDAGGRDIAGSPPYMAPEVASGKPLTRAADIYSLCVVLYELLTLRLPWSVPVRTPDDALSVHRLLPPPPPSEYRPGLPRSIDTLVLRGLSADPQVRPSLDTLVRGFEPLARSDGPHDSIITTDAGLAALVRAGAARSAAAPPGVNASPAAASEPAVQKAPKVAPAADGAAASVLEPFVGTFDRVPHGAISPGAARSAPRVWALAGSTAALLAVGGIGWALWPRAGRPHDVAPPREVAAARGQSTERDAPHTVRTEVRPPWLDEKQPVVASPAMSIAPSASTVSRVAPPIAHVRASRPPPATVATKDAPRRATSGSPLDDALHRVHASPLDSALEQTLQQARGSDARQP